MDRLRRTFGGAILIGKDIALLERTGVLINEKMRIGGILMEKTSTLIGALAYDFLSKMAFDRVFIGTTGATVKHGLSNSNMHEAEIKRFVIDQAAEVNIVMDHTKFGLKDLFSFASLTSIDRIITDRLPDSELAQSFKDASVEIVTSFK
jgi:DeoR family fructose operon transcriptional repressor